MGHFSLKSQGLLSSHDFSSSFFETNLPMMVGDLRIQSQRSLKREVKGLQRQTCFVMCMGTQTTKLCLQAEGDTGRIQFTPIQVCCPKYTVILCLTWASSIKQRVRYLMSFLYTHNNHVARQVLISSSYLKYQMNSRLYIK